MVAGRIHISVFGYGFFLRRTIQSNKRSVLNVVWRTAFRVPANWKCSVSLTINRFYSENTLMGGARGFPRSGEDPETVKDTACFGRPSTFSRDENNERNRAWRSLCSNLKRIARILVINHEFARAFSVEFWERNLSPTDSFWKSWIFYTNISVQRSHATDCDNSDAMSSERLVMINQIWVYEFNVKVGQEALLWRRI